MKSNKIQKQNIQIEYWIVLSFFFIVYCAGTGVYPCYVFLIYLSIQIRQKFVLRIRLICLMFAYAWCVYDLFKYWAYRKFQLDVNCCGGIYLNEIKITFWELNDFERERDLLAFFSGLCFYLFIILSICPYSAFSKLAIVQTILE